MSLELHLIKDRRKYRAGDHKVDYMSIFVKLQKLPNPQYHITLNQLHEIVESLKQAEIDIHKEVHKERLNGNFRSKQSLNTELAVIQQRRITKSISRSKR